MEFMESSLEIGHIDPRNGVSTLPSAQAKNWLGQRAGIYAFYAQSQAKSDRRMLSGEDLQGMSEVDAAGE